MWCGGGDEACGSEWNIFVSEMAAAGMDGSGMGWAGGLGFVGLKRDLGAALDLKMATNYFIHVYYP